MLRMAVGHARCLDADCAIRGAAESCRRGLGGVWPAGLLLFELNGLLQRIGNGAVFEPRNETALRRISWYCIIEAVICVASALYYLPFLLVAVAAGFMALIVRVIKNVFAEAIVLKTEQEFTI